jgi:hypothetical protein
MRKNGNLSLGEMKLNVFCANKLFVFIYNWLSKLTATYQLVMLLKDIPFIMLMETKVVVPIFLTFKVCI